MKRRSGVEEYGRVWGVKKMLRMYENGVDFFDICIFLFYLIIIVHN